MTSNWYQRRLSGEAQPPSGLPPIRTAPPPPAPAPPPAAHYQRPALSSIQTDHCPGCGSGNYMAAPGTSYLRCFDCGYPKVQSGTGVGGSSSKGDVHRATQVASGGFNPSVIVGRVE